MKNRVLACLLWAGCFWPAALAFGQDVTVVDFPLQDGVGFPPAGLALPPMERSLGSRAQIELPFLPVSEDTAVYVTVVFRDQPGTVLRAKWFGEGSRQFERVISENLAEGLQGWNQRTIELPWALVEEPGTLVLEADSVYHTVKRVAIVWASPGVVYAGGSARTVQYLPNSGKGLSESDLADPVREAKVPDTWYGGMWTAPLQERTEPLDDGLEFAVPIDSSPRAAVFRARVLGAPINAAVSLRVNERKIGPVSLEVPGLSDPGYMQDYDGKVSYAGWREVAVILPFGVLRKGDNAIILEPMAGGYIKGAALELKFDESPGAPDVPPEPSQPDLALPVGEISPFGTQFEAEPAVRDHGPVIVTLPSPSP